MSFVPSIQCIQVSVSAAMDTFPVLVILLPGYAERSGPLTI